MGNPRYLTVLVTFALIGTGLAIGIALSSTPTPMPESAAVLDESDQRPRSTATPTMPPREPDSLKAEPNPSGLTRAPRPVDLGLGPVAPGPYTARVAPAYAYQAVANAELLERLRAVLRGQAAAGSAPPSAQDTAASPTKAEKPEPAAARSETPVRIAPAGPPQGAADVHGEGDGRLVINIQDTDLRRVLEMLSEQGGMNILASNNVQGKVSASLSGVDVHSALGAILRSTGYVSRTDGQFIYVGTPEDFEQMEQASDRVGTRVYQPNYVRAADLKDLIQPLLTEKVGVVSVTTPAEVGIATNDEDVGGDGFAGNEALLVRDYEAVLAQIDQVVAEIDVRPMQVHIEAMILSVKLEDDDKFGVDFRKFVNAGKFTVGWGTPVNGLGDIKFTDGGLKFGFFDGDVGVFLEALEHVGEANVIATPRLMVLNKHRADILIGREEGYVSTTQTETATTQTVQFLELGTQLRLRPFISPDGLIRLEVHPELSDGTVEVKGGFTLPNKDVTKVTTNIMIRDGCTVVIGGLMQEQITTTTDQVPFFGNLPWVGAIFRTKEENIERIEICVLLTPHIVYEPGTCSEGEQAACEFHRRQDVIREKMNPLGKRSVARRYFRMAQRAWAAGDRRRALRFAEMAVHFDPTSRAAIDLRSSIWQGDPHGEHTLFGPGIETRSAGGPLDGDVIAPWVLNDLEGGAPSDVGRLMHPRDPGQPGRRREIERPRTLQ